MIAPDGPLAPGGGEDGPRTNEPQAARAGTPRSVSGRASSAGRERVSAHRLTWIDHATGEGLELEMNCDEAFAHGLASTGFVRVARVLTESANEEHATMDTKHDSTPAGTQYAAAHLQHYGSREHVRALQAYERLITQHPDSDEADYARAQIDQIVNQVVPAAELLAAKLVLARGALRPGVGSSAAVGS